MIDYYKNFKPMYLGTYKDFSVIAIRHLEQYLVNLKGIFPIKEEEGVRIYWQGKENECFTYCGNINEMTLEIAITCIEIQSNL